jgi:hypothetical protein
MLELLGGDPAAMLAVPGRLGGIDAALHEQQLGDALAIAKPAELEPSTFCMASRP